jgi:hypothetical protein
MLEKSCNQPEALLILSTWQMRGQEMPIFVMVETQEDEDFSEEVTRNVYAHGVCGACVVKTASPSLAQQLPGTAVLIR